MTSRDSVAITLEPFDHNLLINGMNEFRNLLIRTGRPTEDVDELLLKIIDAPPHREKRKKYLER